MAIEKAMNPVSSNPFELDPVNPEDKGLDIFLDSNVEITEDEEGGVLIDFDPQEDQGLEIPFDANLAEFMDDRDLQKLSSELMGLAAEDKNSRKEWEETYVKGLQELGMKIEDRDTPWPGACGVQHPVLSEAVVRFQAQTITEIFPNAGPVKTKTMGKRTDEKDAQAYRIREYMNYLITEEMAEYRSETEKMLFNLALAGSAFRKVYWDTSLGRPCSMFVPAEDLLVSYGAPSLEMAERITHMMKKHPNELRKLQVAGFYSDIELNDGSPEIGSVEEQYNDLTGDTPNATTDNRHTLYEMSVDYDLPGFEDTYDGDNQTGVALPYIVTIDKRSSSILSIRRNWIEDDENKVSRTHFIHFEYLPGMGFYGFGLIHLIGGIAKSATSLLRQLVDAGTLSNLPGGLKSRGLRIKGDDLVIRPGTFKDVDIPGGSIKDNIAFLPYKEPSNVLHQLLQNIVEEGRRFASITDMKASDMNSQAPVGTTLAIIERSMKVMNAIQSRIHFAMKREFKLLTGIIRDWMPEDYEWEVDTGEIMKSTDFDDRVDVIPVSDPNSSTMAQRIMQFQAALQLAATAPQIYNLSSLHRQMLDTLGIDDVEDIIPSDEDVKSLDPISENMNILTMEPVKAYIWQDHDSHIQSHLDSAKDPKMLKIIQQSPHAKQIEAGMSSHVLEHLGFKYRRELEKELGVTLPPPNEPLPNDVEVRLSALMAEAGSRLLGRDQAEEQMKEQVEKSKDPVIKQQQQKLDIEDKKVQANIKSDAAKIMADLKKAEMKNAMEEKKLQSQEMLKGIEIGLEVSTEDRKMNLEEKKVESEELLEGLKLGYEIANNSLNEGE